MPALRWARSLTFHDPSHTFATHRELQLRPRCPGSDGPVASLFHDPSHTFATHRELQPRPRCQGSDGPEASLFMIPHTLSRPIGSSSEGRYARIRHTIMSISLLQQIDDDTACVNYIYIYTHIYIVIHMPGV